MYDMKPFVSIIIPVLNGEKSAGVCVESILELDYNNFELIIVDNGSKDRTVEIIKSYQQKHNNIKLYFEKIKSSYASRNLGIKNAKGDIIAFTDIDCKVDKKWLTKLIESFVNDSVGGVAGEILSEDAKNLIERYTTKAGVLSQSKNMSSDFPFAATANVAYRKKVFDEIGLFDEKMISGGDVDLSWRMQLNTNYNLVFNKDAIILHKHRSAMKDLFKQSFKYGYGRCALDSKYKDNKSPKYKKIGLISRIKEPFSIIKSSDGETLLFAMIYLIYIIMHRSGRTYGKLEKLVK